METKFQYLIKSRKFWAVVLAVLLMVGAAYIPSFPLTQSQVTNLVYVLIAYILGTAIEDSGVMKNAAGDSSPAGEDLKNG